MKRVLALLTFLISSLAVADIDTCFRDANKNANHVHPLAPLEYCADVIANHPDKISVKSSDGKYNVYGLKNMIYVKTSNTRELLAGDQTELKNIKKLIIDESDQKLFVIQDDSVSVFNLNFIGNVSPVTYYHAQGLKNLLSFKLTEKEEKLALFYENSIQILNAQVDSRHDDEKLRPKLLNMVKGERSELKSPSDLVMRGKKIYVLDSNRLLIYGDDTVVKSPEKVINLIDARSLVKKNDIIYYRNSMGNEIQVVK